MARRNVRLLCRRQFHQDSAVERGLHIDHIGIYCQPASPQFDPSFARVAGWSQDRHERLSTVHHVVISSSLASARHQRHGGWAGPHLYPCVSPLGYGLTGLTLCRWCEKPIIPCYPIKTLDTDDTTKPTLHITYRKQRHMTYHYRFYPLFWFRHHASILRPGCACACCGNSPFTIGRQTLARGYATVTHNDNSGYQSRQYWGISVAKLP